MNMFGRYSFGDYFRDGPTAFGAGRRRGARQPRRRVGRRQHSLASASITRVDTSCWRTSGSAGSATRWTCCRSTSARGRRPTPAFPGLNFDDFTSGLPFFRIEGEGGVRHGFGARLWTSATAATVRSAQNEKQWQFVGNVTKLCRQSHLQVRHRRAPRLQPARPERRAPLGRADVRAAPHARAPLGGGLGLATFLLGDVRRFTRYVSPNPDARERQWRHFYYAQDTWRANSEADAQLRSAARRHQSADRQRGGQRRLARSRHGPDPRRRRRRHRSERQHRELG